MDFGDLAAGGANSARVSALGNSLVCLAQSGVLYGCTGWYSGSALIYILTFANATLPANANPVVPWPKEIIQLQGPNTFSLSIPPWGEFYPGGIVIAASSTAPPNFTLTTTSLVHFK